MHRTLPRLVAIALAAVASVALGCDGGDDTTVTAPTAAFTPDTAAPGPTSIALLPGTAGGASVTIRVTATGIPSFFGAAFRVVYDNTALQFNSMSDSTSFLRAGGVADANLFFMADSTSTSGEVVITATRIDPDVAPPVAVTTTSDLVVLTFTARLAIAAGADEGRIDFAAPMQVCDGTTTPTGCNPVTVTWSGGGLSAQ